MIRRWNTLTRPADSAAPASSPRPADAFGVWMLGTVCALLCLWLGDLGTHSLIPGVLVCGALAILGWRHLESLFWLPALVVLTTLAEPFAPLSARGHFGPLVYVDVLMLAVLVVGAVRALTLRRRLMPKTPVDLVLLALLATAALAAWLEPQGGAGLVQLKNLSVTMLVFYAAVAVAGRPGGSRWVWPAFPLALTLVGLHALWAAGLGSTAFAAQARAADSAWHSREGLLVTLLVALPTSLGLSMDAGHRVTRRMWQAAALIGAAGIAIHLWVGGAIETSAPELTPMRLETVMLALAWVALALLARRAWTLATLRPAESPRWVAIAFTCLAMPLLPLLGLPSNGAAGRFLVAIAGGLIVGTHRAVARDARRAERHTRETTNEPIPEPMPEARAA